MRGVRAAALLTLVAGSGCATKKDMRLLHNEMLSMRAAQDSTLREMERRQRLATDSLSNQGLRTRGDIATRLLAMERQLVQIQELTGQGQQRIAELREEMNTRARELDTRATAPAADAAPTPAANPEELYNASLAGFRRGSLVTARAGFQEFLRAAPDHRLAPDATFYVGETYAQAGDRDRAREAFTVVVDRYPSSTRVPGALLRLGQIEAARGNRTQARATFNRIVQGHPRATEATQAREELRKLDAR